MWEIIQANKRKSVILFIGMGACLILLGYLVGAVFFPPHGGVAGLFIAIFIWIVLSFVSFFGGDKILLSLSGAKEVTHDVHPQLFNIVEEMKIAANLPVMPKVYIIADPAPNAFATGIKPENYAVAVTAGLLSKLNRDELQGVVAHEMSHIMNRDVLFMTFAGILMGSIVLLSEVFLRGMWFSGGSSRRYRAKTSSGGGQAQIVILVVAIVVAILSPLIARLLYLAMSRKREYLADASAVRLTRYPEGLASALEKISSSSLNLASANKVMAPMYIINPLKAEGMKAVNVTSTHPPIDERIRILRNMQAGANYRDYQSAYSKVSHKEASFMPGSAVQDAERVEVRQPSPEVKKQQTNKEKVREVGDLIRAVNHYVFIACLCGMKIKVPPDFKKEKLACPKCGRVHQVPLAEFKEAAAVLAAGAAIGGKLGEKEAKPSIKEEKQIYKRVGTGWETFSCRCGKAMQISPSFRGSHMKCTNCNRTVDIE